MAIVVVVAGGCAPHAYIFYLLVSRNISRAVKRRRPCATAQRVESEKVTKIKKIEEKR